MEIGKVPETVLNRSVFKQIRKRRSEILVHPGIGEDCAVVELAPGEVMVLSTDPITGTVNEIGTLAVHITANDIASGGAEVIGLLLTIILPPSVEEPELKAMMKEIELTCEGLNIEIMGGHTEVSAAVNQPIISVTGVGKVAKDKVITTSGMRPSQDLVMTKWAGLEGTVILASDKEMELRERLPEQLITRARNLGKYLSVIPEAKIAMDIGVTAMHDVTEGGIFGALWEMASASKVGIEVNLKQIPIKQETIEICEVFDLNPYMLMSSGCMLIASDHGNQLVDALRKEGISAAVIGRATNNNDKLILNGGERRYLEPPGSDELYKVQK